jgi:hypothetical protein
MFFLRIQQKQASNREPELRVTGFGVIRSLRYAATGHGEGSETGGRARRARRGQQTDDRGQQFKFPSSRFKVGTKYGLKFSV